jgi:PAS domain S-box-containing protein
MIIDNMLLIPHVFVSLDQVFGLPGAWEQRSSCSMTEKRNKNSTTNRSREPQVSTEDRFRIIAELTSDFAYVDRVEPDGSIVPEWVSDAVTRVTGYTVEEITSQGLKSIILPDDWPRVARHIRKVLSGQSDTIESRIVSKSGEVRWLRGHARPVWDERQARVVLIYGAAQDISEMKRAEEERNRIERDYIDFVENASVALHWVASDGTITWANQAELNMLGYTREEYIGHHIAEFHVDQDEIKDILRRLSNKETLQDYETRLRHKDGSIRHVLVNSNARWDKERFIHTRCFTLDITKNKRAEEARILLSSIIESSDDAILSKSMEGTILSWNKGAQRLYGYTAEEVKGRPVSLLMPPNRADDFPMIMKRLKRGERVEHYETERVRKDGTIVQISVTVSPVKNVAGEIIGASAIARDISERKQLEEEREQLLARELAARSKAEQAQKLAEEMLAREEIARQEAEEAAEKQRAIQKGLVHLVDASAALLASLQVETVLPTVVGLARQVVDADAYAIWRFNAPSSMWQLVATEGLSEQYGKTTGNIMASTRPPVVPQIVAEDVTKEEMLESRLEAYRAEGIKSLLVVPLHIRGQDVGTVGFYYKRPHRFKDTEVYIATALANMAAAAIGSAEMYEEQARLREDAQEASRAKDEFLAMVSHELRTPLNAIVGWAGMLRTGRVDEKTTVRAVETIERNARSQAKLIEDLLDISRIITGKLRLNVQPVELSPVVEAAVDVVRPAAASKDVRLQVVLDPEAGPILGDPERLQQIIWNLLSNAVRFTPKQGRIQVRLERLNSHVEVTVSDTGQGISREFLPFVFDRFRQADGSFTRSHGGLGLGLAIVRHLVELHGGTVSAYSAGEGKGATFTVQFPLMILHAPASPQTYKLKGTDQSVSANEPFESAQSLKGMRLLIVEDEPDARDLLRLMLEQYGAEVKAAQSAKDAFQALEEWKPDLMISDIEMPGEDGYTLIQKIRESEPRQNRLPAIALTAHARAQDRTKALRAGYDAHVAKPVEVNELIIVIESLARTTGKL